MTAKPCNVLFLCTGNSARSILAESILRKEGPGRFRAFSAGSEPKGAVNPLALEVLADAGYPTEGLRSKSWEEFAGPGAPEMNLVITVCDNAAGEVCPIWPGHPTTAHWGISDPASVEGSGSEKQEAFRQALRYMKTRITQLVALPVEQIERKTLGSELQAIAQQAGASPGTPRGSSKGTVGEKQTDDG